MTTDSTTEEVTRSEWKTAILNRMEEIKCGKIAPWPIEEMFRRSRAKLCNSVEVNEGITEQEYQAECEVELNRRIKETELGLGDEISGDEMRRIARESVN